ncbi:MAG TPA: prolyl oligopeptidase family serine peptidase [Bacteroidota bacterium]|nr:prolyl oligopeptidase family serine peptidase [Bacteroidota bacterium]
MTFRQASAALFIVSALIAGCTPSKPPYPATEKKPTTEKFFDTTIADDYRWLENPLDPAVRSWVAAENAFSRSTLDGMKERERIASRLKELYGGSSVSYRAEYYRRKLFATKLQPPHEQPLLVTFDSPDDLSTERTILDPNAIDTSGGTSMDFFVPSPDGRLVAVSLSTGGSENGTACVFETATGRRLPDEVPRVNFATAGGSIAWNAGATGFYYTRYPQGGERAPQDTDFYQQIYFHKLGTPPANDRYVAGKDFPRIAEIALSSSEDGRYMLARVANGDGGEFAFRLMGPGERWRAIAGFRDGVREAVFGRDGKIYLLSTKGASRGQVLSISLARPELGAARTVVPEGSASIKTLVATSNRLYTLDEAGGPEDVRIFSLDGRFRGMLPTAPLPAITALIPMEGDRILYGAETYIEDCSYFLYDPKTNGAARTRLVNRPVADFSDCEVIRAYAPSKDGTKIPLNIIQKKGTEQNGRHPLLLTAYGGFDAAEAPRFSPRNRLWEEQGGILVDANIRGGDEFGEEWHRGGNLTKKQNAFDDFIACAQYLVGQKYTSTDRLAIEGWSNGGLLMGAALTQRPDLFRAVVSHVGIYDMLHIENFPNGQFNVTEYGSLGDPVQFKATLAYSPYHHVTDGTKYPAVLMMTGDNDWRVDPANSRKMTARLQAATGSAHPVLLRTSSASGHGFGSPLDELVAEDVDAFAFLFDQLDMHYVAGGQ